MPVRLADRYEPGSAKERVHRILTAAQVEVDFIWGVEEAGTGVEATTFTANGKALTAFISGDSLVRVVDGWDVPPPDDGLWRSRY